MKPVSLSQVRKERARAERKARADANAVKFGRTKAQRLLEARQATKAHADLSQKRLEDQ